jgi:hypothetical protein
MVVFICAAILAKLLKRIRIEPRIRGEAVIATFTYIVACAENFYFFDTAKNKIPAIKMS